MRQSLISFFILCQIIIKAERNENLGRHHQIWNAIPIRTSSSKSKSSNFKSANIGMIEQNIRKKNDFIPKQSVETQTDNALYDLSKQPSEPIIPFLNTKLMKDGDDHRYDSIKAKQDEATIKKMEDAPKPFKKSPIRIKVHDVKLQKEKNEFVELKKMDDFLQNIPKQYHRYDSIDAINEKQKAKATQSSTENPSFNTTAIPTLNPSLQPSSKSTENINNFSVFYFNIAMFTLFGAVFTGIWKHSKHKESIVDNNEADEINLIASSLDTSIDHFFTCEEYSIPKINQEEEESASYQYSTTYLSQGNGSLFETLIKNHKGTQNDEKTWWAIGNNEAF